MDELSGLARRLPGLLVDGRLGNDEFALGGMFLQVLAEGLDEGGLDAALDLGVAELGLGLTLELGIGDLDADDGCQALPHVFAGEVWLVVLDKLLSAGVVVNNAGESGAEAGQVGPTLLGSDAVGEGVDVLV